MHIFDLYVYTVIWSCLYGLTIYGVRTPDFVISCYLVLLSSIVTRVFF